MAQSIVPEQGSPPPNDQMSAVKVAFPQSQEQFDTDPRVSFSQLSQTWILEDDDGKEWEWNDAIQKWGASLDEDLKMQQQQAYGNDEGEKVEPPSKKRKADDAQNAPSKKSKPPHERKNSAVYVTSLPLDVDADEIASVFKRCGLIAEATDGAEQRIKMYYDENGDFKGEALVVYFKPESVPLAIQMLDDSDFRLGLEGPHGKMRVTEADSSFKKNQDESKKDASAQQSSTAPKRKKKMTKEQKQIIQKTQKMNNRLADWSSDEDRDPSALPQTNPRFDKVVILKHMFTLAELEDDPAAAMDIREDIREEAEKLGAVANVTLFDQEPQGVITVRFRDSRAAQACVDLMNGRHFDGRTVAASIAEGGERFKKRKEKGDDAEAEEEERMEKFGDWLEQEE